MRMEIMQPDEVNSLLKHQETPGEGGQLSEINEFLRYASETQASDVELSPGTFDETGRFHPGRVEEIDPEAQEFDPELQELSQELDTWFQQGESMSCAVATQTMAVNQLQQEDYTEGEMLTVARENHWYANGTYPEDVGKVAEHMGLEVEQYARVPAEQLSIANDPEVKVLANVDSTLLQYPEAGKRCQPDHCVQVLRVESTSQGEFVILNDPGHEGGRGAVYPMEIFQRAFRGDITTIRKAEEA